jgi:hypothetical protein
VFIVNVIKTPRPARWPARPVGRPHAGVGDSLAPPVYNFAPIPTVHGRDELWLQKHGDGHGGAPAPKPARHREGDRRHPHAAAVLLALLLALALASCSRVSDQHVQVVVGGLLTLSACTSSRSSTTAPPQEAH